MNRKFFFAMCLLTANALFGGVENHLKKIIVERPKDQGLKGVDFIYMINLDQRPEKYLMSVDQLVPYRIFPFRFSACNGWELTIEDIMDVAVKYDPATMEGNHWGTTYLPENNGQPQHELVTVPERPYFCHCMSRGAIGIVLSHTSILQDAWEQGYETIWVMEDDIQVLQDPHLITERIKLLDKVVGKQGWDVMFTDQDTKNQEGKYVPCQAYAWRPNFNPSDPYRFIERKNLRGVFRKVGARYGAYSMILRRSGVKKILDFIKEHSIFLPYDMDFYLPEGINMYAVLDDIVSTLPKAQSDNGGPNYKKNTQGVDFNGYIEPTTGPYAPSLHNQSDGTERTD